LKILVIAEDPRKDAYMIIPIVKAMLTHLGKPTAKVQASYDSRLRGFSAATDWTVLKQIVEENTLYDVYLLCVDRDAKEGRKVGLDNLERRFAEEFGGLHKTKLFIAEHAWQEIEVWLLAGCTDLPQNWKWSEVRAEEHPKEMYFDKYVTLMKLDDTPGRGRMPLGKRAGVQYANRLRSLSPELQDIEAKLAI